VFSGDTLFHGSIGRTDFPGCSLSDLLTAIKTKLLTLPGDTAVYPGHGNATSIGEEKMLNPFLKNYV
jgi:glyoxylase-like metal-dependent hydrolase (beta-lactamase superfamily II)